MNSLQVAEDYANEEGFDFTRRDDGSVEIWHPHGAARVYADGRIISAQNFRLKAVLEKKLAASRAKEAALIEDPSGRCTIKFSNKYEKTPWNYNQTKLLAVLKVKKARLSPQFIEWDTKFRILKGNFPLPDGQEFLVLLLLSEQLSEPPRLWTTIRAAWPPEKEEYYRSHIGELVNIEVKE
jgi:hypothetical protein